MSNNIKVSIGVNTGAAVNDLRNISRGFQQVTERTAEAIGASEDYSKTIQQASTQQRKAAGDIATASSKVDNLTAELGQQTKAIEQDNQARQKQLQLMNKLDAQMDKLDLDFREQVEGLELSAANYVEFATRVDLAKKSLNQLKSSLESVDFNDSEQAAVAFTNVNAKLRETSDKYNGIKNDIRKVSQEADTAAKMQIFAEIKKQAEITKSGSLAISLGKKQFYIEKEKLEQLEKHPKVLNQIVYQYERMNQSVSSTVPVIGNLASTLAYSLGGVISAKGIFDTAQDFARLRNELQLTVLPGEQASGVLKELFEVANASKQPIDAAVSAYNTFKKNTLELGLSQQQLKALTETTTKAIAIGGSTADAAKNSMIQFGQALSLGKLSGQNFNSVAEQTPGLVEAIAKGLGMTSAQLKNYANDGKLTTEEIVTALTNASIATEQTFNSLDATVEGSLNMLRNNFMQLVGENDFFSSKIAGGIQFVAQNLGSLAEFAKQAVWAFVGFKTYGIAQHLMELSAKTKETTAAVVAETTAVNGGRLALLAKSATNAATAVTQGALTVAVHASRMAFVALATTLKSMAIGWLLQGVAYGVELIVDWVSKWRSEQAKLNTVINHTSYTLADVRANYETASKDISKRQEELVAREKHLNEEIAKTEAALAKSKQVTDNLTKSTLMYGASVGFAVNETDRLRKSLANLNALKAQNDQQLKDHKAQVAMVDQVKKEREQAYKPPVFKAPQMKMPGGGGGAKSTAPKADKASAQAKQVDQDVQKLNTTITQLDDMLAAANYKLQHASEFSGGVTSELSKLNMQIALGQNGLGKATQEQINLLRQKASEIDKINQLEAQNKAARAIEEKLASQREHIRLSQLSNVERERENRLTEYQLQLEEIKKNSYGEQQTRLIESLNMNFQMQESIIQTQAAQEQYANSLLGSFRQGLEEQMPKMADFGNLAMQSFGQVSDAIATAAMGGKVNFGNLVREIIAGFVKMAVRAALFAATIRAIDAFTGGAASATLNLMAAPSRAVGQAQAAMGTSLISKAISAMSGGGFMSGGYTGNGARYAPAGVVHGQEFVLNADATRRYGVDTLEKMNSGKLDPDDLGGKMVNAVTNKIQVIINNMAGVNVQAQETNEGLVVNIMKKVDERIMLYDKQRREEEYR